MERELFVLAPAALAESWDNVGLLLGDPDRGVTRVLVALDVTEAVADEAIAWGAELIVAHHPVMNCHWSPVQSVRSDTPQGHLLCKLLRSEIAVICMHTNLDATPGGVNDALAAALRVNDPGPLDTATGIGRVGTLAEPLALRAFVRQVRTALRGNGLRYADAGKPVFRVAVGGGACGDFIDRAVELGCDTFVTADLGYHAFMDAKGKGINLIDAGHFPTEDVVCPVLVAYLQKTFPPVEILKSTSHCEVIQYEL
ncbi:MAG: Nif3-like dinuclear metal center hexameric protein [Oscillospiraceae bacterium]